MKSRNFVSLSLSLAFLSLSITGLLLYLVRHNKATTSIHVVFGLLFLAFAFFHISNNWSSLISYANNKTGISIQKELLLSLLVVVVFLIGTGVGIPPFSLVEPLGEAIRNGGDENRREMRVMFNEIETNADKPGSAISVILQKDRNAILPIIAIWVEDSTHVFVENLFVPAKTLNVENGEEDVQEAIREGEVEENPLEAALLPTWNAKTKDKQPNYQWPTPTDDFILKTRVSASGSYFVALEIKTANNTEVYEAVIDPSKGTVFSFNSKDGSILKRAIVEINR